MNSLAPLREQCTHSSNPAGSTLTRGVAEQVETPTAQLSAPARKGHMMIPRFGNAIVTDLGGDNPGIGELMP
jgi:hypothetical protein